MVLEADTYTRLLQLAAQLAAAHSCRWATDREKMLGQVRHGEKTEGVLRSLIGGVWFVWCTVAQVTWDGKVFSCSCKSGRVNKQHSWRTGNKWKGGYKMVDRAWHSHRATMHMGEMREGIPGTRWPEREGVNKRA